MAAVGFQDFWVVGSRFYFKRNDVSGVKQPSIDLGVITQCTPTITPTKIELKDTDGGTKRLVDERVTEIVESYDITCANLNLDNLSLILLGTAPTTFTQTAQHKRVTTYCHAGRLVKVIDSDTAGTPLYSLGAIAGILSAQPSAGVFTVGVLTTIVASTKTLTITAGTASDFDAGDKIVVPGTGLANIANARTYTVVSASGAGPVNIVVSESPAANETAITGELIYKNDTGDTGTVYSQDVDWEVVSTDRGFVRIKEGGTIAADGNLCIVFSTAAVSGKRLVLPQTAGGEIKGTGFLIFGRGGNAEQTVRECSVSITPSSTNFSIDDYSNFVLSVKVITDPTSATPAGRLYQFKGTLPSAS